MPERTLGSEDLVGLADYLRQKDFAVGAAELLAAQRLLWRLAEQGVAKPAAELAPWLAPIFATTPREQDAFADLYRDWRVGPEPAPPSPPKTRRRPIGSVAAILLAVLAGTGWWVYNHRVIPGETLIVRPPGQPTGPPGVVIPQPPPDPTIATVTGTLLGDKLEKLPYAHILFDGNDVVSDAHGFFRITGKASMPVLATHCDYDAVLFPLVNSTNLVLHMKKKASQGCIPGSGPPVPNDPRPAYRRLRIAVSSLPVIAFLLWAAYVFWKRAGLRTWRGAAGSAFARFPLGDSTGLFSDTALQRGVQELRRPLPTTLLDMWPEPTVTATVENAGWFTPVYRARRRTAEYLVLIDRAGKRDHQTSFATELLDSLTARGVFAHVYYFHSDPRTCSEPGTGRRVALNDLSARFGYCQVWIVADGSTFFSAFTGRIERWVDTFQQWPARVLLTTASPTDWGDRERRLADLGFEIVPATPRGLARIADHFAAGEVAIDSYPPLLEDRPARWASNQSPTPGEITRLRTELRLYLGRDGLRWLAACAEYPVLEWPLTLYLGRVLMPPETLQPVLQKLVRLPWFRRGSMPNWLRVFLAGMDKNLRPRVLALLAARLKAVPSTAAGPASAKPTAVEVAVERDYQRRVEEDEVWLSFLWERKPDGALPAAGLRKLLFEKGRIWLGPRPFALLAASVLLAGGTWWGMGYGMPTFKPAEPQIERIALDVAMSQYHDPAYYAASYDPKGDVTFPVWCYNVTQLLLRRSIKLGPPESGAKPIPGAVSRGKSEYGVVAGAGWSLVFQNGRIAPRQGHSPYQVGRFVDGTMPIPPPVPTSATPPSPPPSDRSAASIDWSPHMLPVRNQGSENSATGFAMAAAMEFQIPGQLHQSVRLSPRDIYYAARTTPVRDSGATFPAALAAMKNVGAVADAVWPYQAGQFAQEPPPQVASAPHYRLIGETELKGLDQIRAALAVAPIVVAVPKYLSGDAVTKTGILRIPLATTKGERLIFGLALCLVGYDDQRRQFKFINSWGTGWGEKGYGYLPYDYPQARFWSLNGIVAVAPPPANQPPIANSATPWESPGRPNAALTTVITAVRPDAVAAGSTTRITLEGRNLNPTTVDAAKPGQNSTVTGFSASPDHTTATFILVAGNPPSADFVLSTPGGTVPFSIRIDPVGKAGQPEVLSSKLFPPDRIAFAGRNLTGITSVTAKDSNLQISDLRKANDGTSISVHMVDSRTVPTSVDTELTLWMGNRAVLVTPFKASLRVEDKPGEPTAQQGLNVQQRAAARGPAADIAKPSTLPRITTNDPTRQLTVALPNGKIVEVVVGDITTVQADMIVNSVSSTLVNGGSGVDGAIHRAAGPSVQSQLDKIRLQRKYRTGEAVVTGSGNLASHGVKQICHAIGPVYGSDPKGAPGALSDAYQACLQRADADAFTTIAFPAISEGINGYPPAQAAPIAVNELVTFLKGSTSIVRATLVLTQDTFTMHYRALMQLATPPSAK
jgi:O-acetyl-ADP-ribose deacetylase (regulator of RNase III)